MERDERRFQIGINGPGGPITNRELAERILDGIAEIEEIDELGVIIAIISEETYELLECQDNPIENGLTFNIELDNVKYEFEIPGI